MGDPIDFMAFQIAEHAKKIAEHAKTVRDEHALRIDSTKQIFDVVKDQAEYMAKWLDDMRRALSLPKESTAEDVAQAVRSLVSLQQAQSEARQSEAPHPAT